MKWLISLVTGRWMPLLMLIMALAAYPNAAHAARAALVVDADNGRVLSAENANLASFPASLTKLMTIYLLLEAIDTGMLRFDQKLPVSARAARTPPVKLGLQKGEMISVKQAILALIVRSANDAAVVAAEALGGSEAAFAKHMNIKARGLGMTRTTFRNASGLPHPEQLTTARDMAILARAIYKTFPHHYPLFATRSFSYANRRYASNNSFLSAYPGADGLKTGFTCKAGFNLVILARRNNRRLIGVVLGERSRADRNARMAKLLNAGFSGGVKTRALLTLDNLITAPKQGGQHGPNGNFLANACLGKKAATTAKAQANPITGWTIEIGRKFTAPLARKAAASAIAARGSLKGGRPIVIPLPGTKTVYRACVTGLTRRDAIGACFHFHEVGAYCKVLNPRTATIAFRLAESRLNKLGSR